MDIGKYIASGILEAYALDTLSAEERKEVERMITRYPELKAELESIERSLEDFAMDSAINPPTGLKDAILASIDEVPEADVSEEGDSPIVPMAQTAQVWKYLVAASVTLTLVSGYMAFDYRSKWKSTDQAYADLLASNALMAEQYNNVNNRLESIEQDISVLSNAEFQRVNLAGTENAQTASASVFWNSRTQELYLNIQNLKTLSQDQQYQLWAIVDGQPVDAGVFDSGSEGLLKMKDIAKVSAFAVTIEDRGGSETPSLETMQVIGNV